MKYILLLSLISCLSRGILYICKEKKRNNIQVAPLVANVCVRIFSVAKQQTLCRSMGETKCRDLRLELHQFLPQEPECWSGSSKPTSLRVTRGFLKPFVPTECQHSEYSSPSISPLLAHSAGVQLDSHIHCSPLFCFLPSPALQLSACLFVGTLIAAARAKTDSEITRRHCLFNFWLFYF